MLLRALLLAATLFGTSALRAAPPLPRLATAASATRAARLSATAGSTLAQVTQAEDLVANAQGLLFTSAPEAPGFAQKTPQQLARTSWLGSPCRSR